MGDKEGSRSGDHDRWETRCYVKPSIVADKSKNIKLRRIATRGVVRLFNAVKDRQADVQKNLKKARTMAQQDKVIRSSNKGAFYSKLYPSDQSSSGGKEVKAEPEDLTSKWEVLRDNFLVSPNLNSFRDWDKGELS